MTPEEYDQFTRPHRRALRQLALDLEFFIADTVKQSVFSVESRVKTLASAQAKAERLKIPIGELQDIAGMRIVVATSDVVEVIASHFERRASISKDLTIHKGLHVARDDGYRSTHLVTEFSGWYTRSVHSGRLEIQIPTIFEHAFNFLSHAWVYKSNARHGADWARDFKQMSQALRSLDEQATTLHRGAHEKSRLDPDSEALTPLVYQRVIREEFNEEVTLKDATDYSMIYVDLGVTTMGQMQQFLRSRDVEDLWNEYGEEQGCSKSLFWSMHGTRLPHSRKFLEEFRQIQLKKTKSLGA